jgi:hypothetical protein
LCHISRAIDSLADRVLFTRKNAIKGNNSDNDTTPISKKTLTHSVNSGGEHVPLFWPVSVNKISQSGANMSPE